MTRMHLASVIEFEPLGGEHDMKLPSPCNLKKWQKICIEILRLSFKFKGMVNVSLL